MELNNTHTCKNEQFGFKELSSCDHAVSALKKVILYNKRKKQVTFVCTLDASKAFDKVNRTLLCGALVKVAAPYVTRAFINYYNSLKLLVYSDKIYSTLFTTKLGLKQGGPASPRLFALYLEKLTEILGKSEVGIKIGKLLINHLIYADDVILVANSTNDLNTLLKLTGEFGKTNEIKFNPNKTQYIIFDSKRIQKSYRNVYFNGEILSKVNNIKYLGNHLDTRLSNKHLDHRILCLYHWQPGLK